VDVVLLSGRNPDSSGRLRYSSLQCMNSCDLVWSSSCDREVYRIALGRISFDCRSFSTGSIHAPSDMRSHGQRQSRHPGGARADHSGGSGGYAASAGVDRPRRWSEPGHRRTACRPARHARPGTAKEEAMLAVEAPGSSWRQRNRDGASAQRGRLSPVGYRRRACASTAATSRRAQG